MISFKLINDVEWYKTDTQEVIHSHLSFLKMFTNWLDLNKEYFFCYLIKFLFYCFKSFIEFVCFFISSSQKSIKDWPSKLKLYLASNSKIANLFLIMFNYMYASNLWPLTKLRKHNMADFWVCLTIPNHFTSVVIIFDCHLTSNFSICSSLQPQ